jgi:hypothetical protein
MPSYNVIVAVVVKHTQYTIIWKYDEILIEFLELEKCVVIDTDKS